MEQEIIYLKTGDIYENPNNPRKDLGDLQELTDSIRKKGIMQNLTVIPGHYLTDEEWKTLAKEYKTNPSEAIRIRMNTINSNTMVEEGYTLLIGHRRFAAGKKAGITEFPCRIVDQMDKKEQVGIMLEENMQRNDLTIWEQANGFQMMLDLGETEDQIAEKTGFSKTTIRHRINIAKLDQEVLKKTEQNELFQLTLNDLYTLEQVHDVGKRNQILKEATSSRDLIWKAQSVAADEKRDKKAKKIIDRLKKIGIEQAPKKAVDQIWSRKWETLEQFDLDTKEDPDIADAYEEGSLYIRMAREIRIIKEQMEKNEEAEADRAKREEQEKSVEKIRDIEREMSIERYDMVMAIIEGRVEPVKDELEIIKALWKAIIGADSYSGTTARECATVLKGRNASWYTMSKDERDEATEKLEHLSVVQQIMISAYIKTRVSTVTAGYSGEYIPENAEIVIAMTDALKAYGFSYKDAEAVLDGTSRYFAAKQEGEE
jgi:ParB family chromosome partitioning protein